MKKLFLFINIFSTITLFGMQEQENKELSEQESERQYLLSLPACPPYYQKYISAKDIENAMPNDMKIIINEFVIGVQNTKIGPEFEAVLNIRLDYKGMLPIGSNVDFLIFSHFEIIKPLYCWQSCDYQSWLCIFDLKNGKIIKEIAFLLDPVGVIFSNDGEYIIFDTNKDNIFIFNTKNKDIKEIKHPCPLGIYQYKLSEDGEHLWVRGLNDDLSIINIETFEVNKYNGHGEFVKTNYKAVFSKTCIVKRYENMAYVCNLDKSILHNLNPYQIKLIIWLFKRRLQNIGMYKDPYRPIKLNKYLTDIFTKLPMYVCNALRSNYNFK